ncbi:MULTISPECIES: nif-specific transcriptional activator NifA [Rhizobium]|nr:MULTISPECIES: nif-specific transcriptional activator NifA [Rhizobium]MCS0463104.1 nif-specific transcriptional activator NifA [Rhizobium favelukesii]UFS84863.1 nif-specific transcriptional activator NifA [Rhizobium sp. T136]
MNTHNPDMWRSGIYRISRDLLASSRLEIAFSNVLNSLSLLLPMRHGEIVISAEEGKAEVTICSGFGRDSPSPTPTIKPKAAIEHIIATGAALVVPDIRKSDLFNTTLRTSQDGNLAVTFMGVPIKAGKVVLGALWIDRVKTGTTSDNYKEEILFLTMVANLTGSASRLNRDVCRDGESIIEERAERISRVEGKPGPTPRTQISWIVGESPALKEVVQTAAIVATTNSAVLLRGESGTGKESFARAIHELSARRKKPFVKLNCAALSSGVLESELFGHEKGAFTGAISQRAGRFELADGGTLLLDEIGEISPEFQAKLLRVLQEGELERVGGTKTLKVNVRLICATNRDLETAVACGTFRADLYYRINVVPIILPPLRQREGDIPRLAKVFLKRFNEENDRNVDFSPSALDILSRCDFPGNVRELENCVQRTATLAGKNTIVPSDFACQQGRCFSSLLGKGADCNSCNTAISDLVPGNRVLVGPPANSGTTSGPASTIGAPSLTDRDRLINAMEMAGWVQARAARILGLTPRQVGYALRRLRIEVKKF